MAAISIVAPDLWHHAVDTFGTEQKALLWFRQPLAELGERSPERVLLEDSRKDLVEAILSRIDYGVYG